MFLLLLTPTLALKATDTELDFLTENIKEGISWVPVSLYENIIVYIDDAQLYTYDVNTGEETKLLSEGLNPQIFGDNIVYSEFPGDSPSIYIYNIRTKTRSKIAEANSYELYKLKGPLIYGNNIIWQEQNEERQEQSLYLHNLNNKETKKIDTLKLNDSTDVFENNLSIFENKIVYNGKDEEGKYYLKIYNTETENIISIKPNSFFIDQKANADIYGDYIVLEGRDKATQLAERHIYLYDIGNQTEKQITTNTDILPQRPSIYQDKIVWEAHDNGYVNIYLYDLNTNKEYKITNNEFIPVINAQPTIYKNTIVFAEALKKDELDLNNKGNNLYKIKVINKITEENPIIDQSLSKRLSGKLLLQVEDKGRIWYVSTKDNHRYEVTFANALPLFQKQALGISNANLYKIPIHINSVTKEQDMDKDGFSDFSEVQAGYNPEIASNLLQRGNDKLKLDSSLANSLKGRFLLQVENKGRIWYVDANGYRWEVTWNNLMSLFRQLALGINNTDLNKIASGTL